MQVDLSQLDFETRAAVDEIFRSDYELKVLQAVQRQQAVAARNSLYPPRAKDGFGEKKFEIDAFLDAVWRNYYGHDYSMDTDLMRFLSRRNPEICVKSQASKIQFGYTPGASAKWRKKYSGETELAQQVAAPRDRGAR
jgi:hypothetical protein